MEYATVKALLDKYWEAETSLEEEAALAAYFRQPDVDARLEGFRGMFLYFEQEARVRPGEGFENRILEAVRRADEAGNTGAPVRRLWRGVKRSVAAAAAVVLVIGLFLMVPTSRRAAGPAVASGTGSTVVEPGGAAAAPIKDTYDNPQQALTAIRQALLTASSRMSEGKELAQKNMDRATPALQTIKKVI